MQEKNPWKKTQSEHIYTNEWIDVREDQVINPGGNKGIYGVVSFKNLAIGIVPIDHELNTYLVGQYRYPLDIYSWEIPMGGGLKDDTPLQSAKRELEEETGLTARKWEQIMKLHTSNSVTDEEGYIFIATDLTQGKAMPEETEELKVKKIPLAQAYQMVMNSEITDAISIAGILKAAILYKLV